LFTGAEDELFAAIDASQDPIVVLVHVALLIPGSIAPVSRKHIIAATVCGVLTERVHRNLNHEEPDNSRFAAIILTSGAFPYYC
jgi:hypothetical protein